MDTAERVRVIAARMQTDGFRERLGECYRHAMQRFLEGAGTALVHGTIQVAGRPSKHAWVRYPDGTCWDPTTACFWSAHEYRELFRARERIAYSRDRALALMLSLHHAGPWDDYPEYEDEWHPRAMADTEGL